MEKEVVKSTYQKDTAIEFLTRCIQLSLTDNLPEDIYAIHGMSSNRVRNLLNHIGKIRDFNYLEIGCWQGSTAIATLHQSNFKKAYLIDNWSEFGNVRDKCMMNLALHLSRRSGDIKLFSEDSFEMDLQKIEDKIHVYFYDGDHSFQSHYKALTYYYPVLFDWFIYIVDDYNVPDVQQATWKAIADLKLKMKFMTYLPSESDGDRKNYWNGLGVFLLLK